MMKGFKVPTLPNVEDIDFKKLAEEEGAGDIDQYFTKNELAQLSDYEKLRYRNMKKNYEMMIKLGLPAQKPEFMLGQKKTKRKAIRTDSDSDEEWKPSYEKTKRKPSQSSTSRSKEKGAKRREKPKKSLNSQLEETSVSQGSSQECNKPVHRYPQRKLPHTNYMYLEVPDDDEFMYCEDCETEYEGDCPTHSTTHISDSVTTTKSERRAIETLPDGLSVRESRIPNAGLGVWADRVIQIRSRFGPYEGEITKDAEKAHATGYAWQVYENGMPSHFVDAYNKCKSNWMRYVNCARNESEQNLIAYQYRGQIYYRSFKEISPGAELLVWYGQEYAKDLGIERLDIKELLKPKYINGEEVFSCPLCQVSFSGERFLSNHLKYRHSTKLEWLRNPESTNIDQNYLFQCGICQKHFNTQDLTKQHHQIFHGNATKINISKYSNINLSNSSRMKSPGNSTNQKTLKGHSVEKRKNDLNNIEIRQDSNLNNLPDTHTDNQKCNLFGKEFSKDIDLQTHMRWQCGDKCDVCGKVFSHSHHLLYHMKTHTGDKPYKFDVCGKGFGLSHNFIQTHMRTHIGDKPYKCDVCGKGFSMNGNLQKHMRTHTGDKPYKCDVCGKGFSMNGNLQKHMMTHTGEKPYKCDVCGKRFSQHVSLQTHKRTHTGDKPYKCDLCGKRFSQHVHLQIHMRTHIGDKPYKCDICGKGFSQSHHLQTHKRTHTGDKPYKCDVCGKGFSQHVHLQIHMRTHIGDKPYKCDVCGKGFGRTFILHSHMRTHTGDKPYKCDICGKGFSQHVGLQTHKRTHTGDKPYKCDVCGKGFINTSNLNVHMKTHDR